mmetsp:Transcript_10911/g.33883  ORF Transcript_10911/g.33883 Transcript_10911/m.33883 type:complete len:300 (-) Transcript_10911:1049-1948(-)
MPAFSSVPISKRTPESASVAMVSLTPLSRADSTSVPPEPSAVTLSRNLYVPPLQLIRYVMSTPSVPPRCVGSSCESCHSVSGPPFSALKSMPSACFCMKMTSAMPKMQSPLVSPAYEPLLHAPACACASERRRDVSAPPCVAAAAATAERGRLRGKRDDTSRRRRPAPTATVPAPATMSAGSSVPEARIISTIEPVKSFSPSPTTVKVMAATSIVPVLVPVADEPCTVTRSVAPTLLTTQPQVSDQPEPITQSPSVAICTTLSSKCKATSKPLSAWSARMRTATSKVSPTARPAGNCRP